MDKEKVKKQIKEHNLKFIKQFVIGFIIVTFLTFTLGYFDWFTCFFDFKITDKIFEITATIIGLLGVLLGFTLTALGVIISGVQNRFQSETVIDTKTKLNEYWAYLIGVAKPTIFLLLGYTLTFTVCLTLTETFKLYNKEVYLIIWIILSTLLTCYIVFDRIFDYYENPFE